MLLTGSLFDTPGVSVLLDANYCAERVCEARIGFGKILLPLSMLRLEPRLAPRRVCVLISVSLESALV